MIAAAIFLLSLVYLLSEQYYAQKLSFRHSEVFCYVQNQDLLD